MARPSTHPEINAYRRDTLINAAIECAAELGLEGASIRSIAAAANVSPGLVGHYFESRDVLLAAAHQRLCEIVETAIMEAIGETPGSLVSALEAIVSTVFSVAVLNERNVKAFLAFWHASGTHSAIKESHEQLYTAYRLQVTAVLAEIARTQPLRVTPNAGATMFIGLIDGLWLEIAMERKLRRDEAIRTCNQFIRQCLLA